MSWRRNMSKSIHPGNRLSASILCVTICLLLEVICAHRVLGQVTPEEHASHHPDQAASASATEGANSTPSMAPGNSTQAATSDAGAMAGGTAGGGMGDMMKNMGAPPPLEIYPTLMNLPEMTPEQREEIRAKADRRMEEAVSLLATGLDRLGAAAETRNYAAMQDATAKMHQALSLLESGVAAQRALAEGQPPQQVALQWFKNEMNLQPPQGVEVRHGLWGVSLFHLFAMVLLIAFTVAMIGLYFVKMRRAAALFSRIEASKGAPPPGAAPALAGTLPPPIPETNT